MAKKLTAWKTVPMSGGNVTLTIITPRSVGFKYGADRGSFVREVVSSRVGVQLCPAGLAEQLYRRYDNQPHGEILRVAEGLPAGPLQQSFMLKRVREGQSEIRQLFNDGDTCPAGEKWVFVIPATSPAKPKD